jgi:hypothetical protein
MQFPAHRLFGVEAKHLCRWLVNKGAPPPHIHPQDTLAVGLKNRLKWWC